MQSICMGMTMDERVEIKSYKKTDGYKFEKIIYENKFMDLNALLDYVENTPPNYEIFGTTPGSVKDDYEFTKTKNLEEAVQLCRSGYQIGYEHFMDMCEELETEMPAISGYRRGVRKGISGFAPNVPAYLRGEPTTMYQLEAEPEYKFIKIYNNCSYSGRTSDEQIMHKGIILVELIELLQKIGYRVDLEFFELSKSNNEWLYTSVNLKESGDILSPKDCYFPLCHPSWLRRILFRVLEATPGISAHWARGYGMPAIYEETEEFLGLKGKEDILVSIPKDLDIKGVNLIDDANSMLRKLNINKYIEASGTTNLLYNPVSRLNIFE